MVHSTANCSQSMPNPPVSSHVCPWMFLDLTLSFFAVLCVFLAGPVVLAALADSWPTEAANAVQRSSIGVRAFDASCWASVMFRIHCTLVNCRLANFLY